MRLDPVANMLTQGANYFSLPEFKFIIGFPDVFSLPYLLKLFLSVMTIFRRCHFSRRWEVNHLSIGVRLWNFFLRA